MPSLLDGVYSLLLLAASPWLMVRAIRQGKYRAGWREKLLGSLPAPAKTGRRIWWHAVSVGEVHLLGPLLRESQRRFPDVEHVITTTTHTGLAAARERYPEQLSCYAPLDFSWAVRRAIRRVCPDLLVLVELELWPQLIRTVQRNGIPLAICNGRLGDRSFRGYRHFRWFFAPLLRGMRLVAAQDNETARRFRELGAREAAVHVTGSVKYDGVETDRENPRTMELRELAGIRQHEQVFVAGSTGDPEEAAVLSMFDALHAEFPHLRLVLVPRHPERFETVAKLLDASGHTWQRRSQLRQGITGEASRILLVDAMGELSAWWGLADVAFVGGSLNYRGGQNMIEPAAYAAAVCFGPHTHNFRDIVASLLNADGARVVHDAGELTAFARRCLEDLTFREGLGTNARRHVLSQLGSTQRTVDLLEPLLGAEINQTQRQAA